MNPRYDISPIVKVAEMGGIEHNKQTFQRFPQRTKLMARSKEPYGLSFKSIVASRHETEQIKSLTMASNFHITTKAVHINRQLKLSIAQPN